MKQPTFIQLICSFAEHTQLMRSKHLHSMIWHSTCAMCSLFTVQPAKCSPIPSTVDIDQHYIFVCNFVTVNFHLYHSININRRQSRFLSTFKPLPSGLHANTAKMRVHFTKYVIIINIICALRFAIVHNLQR